MEKLWDVVAVADFLGMSKFWVDKRVASNLIPYMKIGRNTRFDPAKIRAWAEEQSHGPGSRE